MIAPCRPLIASGNLFSLAAKVSVHDRARCSREQAVTVTRTPILAGVLGKRPGPLWLITPPLRRDEAACASGLTILRSADTSVARGRRLRCRPAKVPAHDLFGHDIEQRLVLVRMCTDSWFSIGIAKQMARHR